MEYIYAAMLLHKAGKEISEKSLTQVLKAADINLEPTRVKALVASLSEVDIDEAIKSAPSMTIAAAAPSTTPSAEQKPAEEAKEKKEDEKAKEEAALEGLGALFG